MQTRNITLSLPADLIRSAKVYAAGHGTTINGFVKELLSEALSSESRTRAAAQRIIEIARSGRNSTIDPASIRREELYERR